MSDRSASTCGPELPVLEERITPPQQPVLHPRFSEGISRYVVHRGTILRSIIVDYEEVMGDLVHAQTILKEAARHLEASVSNGLHASEENAAVADRLHKVGSLARTIDAANGLVLLHLNKRLKAALGELLDFAGQLSVGCLSDGSEYGGSRVLEGIVKASELVLVQMDSMLKTRNLKGGPATLSCQVVDVQDIVNCVESRAALAARDRDVQLRTNVSSPAEKCWMNQEWFETILGNVVENTISVSARGAQVSIEAGLDEARNIEISISTSKHRAIIDEPQAALTFFGAHDDLYIEHQKGNRIAGVLEKFLLRTLGASASVTQSPAGGVGITILLEACQNAE